MTQTKLFSLMIVGIFAVAMPMSAYAQDDDKKEEAAPLPHCSPKLGEMCDKLVAFAETGGDTWKVAMYGSTACSNSRALQTERRARRDRAEYETRMARAAKEKGTEYKPPMQSESNEQFSARTNSQCDGSYAHYCVEMQREADVLKKAEEKQASIAFIDSVCGSQTASAAAPPAPPAEAAKKK